MSIVKFPSKEAPEEPEELVLLCECGCTTFHVLTTGVLECSACGDLLDDDLTGVARKEVTEVQDAETRTKTHFSSEEFAFRSVVTKAQLASTAAVVVMNKDGSTHFWSCAPNAPSEEEIDWYQTRVEQMMEQFVDRHRR